MAENSNFQCSHVDHGGRSITTNIPLPSSLKFLVQSIKNLHQNPLTSDNYPIWSNQLFKIFQANEFDHFLDQETPTPPQFVPAPNNQDVDIPNPQYQLRKLIDRNLSAALTATISTSILPHVLDLSTTAEIWTSLKRRFQSTSRSRIIKHRNDLHALSMKDHTMTQYLTEAKNITDLLAAAGAPMNLEDLIIYTLNGLPAAYQGFKINIRIRLDPVPLEDFYSLLCSEETHLAH